MKVTLDLPDEWADCLPAKEEELAQVVVAGLQRRKTRGTHEIGHLADIMETLAGLPSPAEVLALRPSLTLSERITFLLEKKRNEGLSSEEQTEWDEIMRVEHLVRIAKAKAAIKLRSDPARK